MPTWDGIVSQLCEMAVQCLCVQPPLHCCVNCRSLPASSCCIQSTPSVIVMDPLGGCRNCEWSSCSRVIRQVHLTTSVLTPWCFGCRHEDHSRQRHWQGHRVLAVDQQDHPHSRGTLSSWRAPDKQLPTAVWQCYDPQHCNPAAAPASSHGVCLCGLLWDTERAGMAL